MAQVEFQDVSKMFPDGTRAVDAVNLTVADGELRVLLGPSGCGKSTLLRLLAGLESPTTGCIRIGGVSVEALSPRERNVAMVFQNYALYPHLSVYDNLAFPLRMRKITGTEIDRRVRETAGLLEIDSLLDRRPAHLSGGQAQRVAMGRAIIRQPAVFLLDEPLSNLDARLRVNIRTEIAALQRRVGITMIYVTHDQVEAMTLGHKVSVLRGGRLQQTATPDDLYRRPDNMFVAGFLGSPQMNIFPVSVESGSGGCRLRFADWSMPLDRALASGRIDDIRYAGLRPEAFRIGMVPASGVSVEVEVEDVERLGHEQIVYVRSPGKLVDPLRFRPDQTDFLGGRHLAARLPADLRIRRGAALQLSFPIDALYLFDQRGRVIRP